MVRDLNVVSILCLFDTGMRDHYVVSILCLLMVSCSFTVDRK